VRWCCEEYKENAGAGKVTLIGIRHQESTRRAKRNEVEISSRKFSGTLEGFEQYRQENEDLDRQIQMMTGDRDTLERYAREQFYFAEPGDDVYIIEK
jgi:hypothetical protein